MPNPHTFTGDPIKVEGVIEELLHQECFANTSPTIDCYKFSLW